MYVYIYIYYMDFDVCIYIHTCVNIYLVRPAIYFISKLCGILCISSIISVRPSSSRYFKVTYFGAECFRLGAAGKVT